MANEVLVQTIKKCVGLTRSGLLSEAYVTYCDLFSSPAFMSYMPTDQRQALGLMIRSKMAPPLPTPEMCDAHRSAVAPLTELVVNYHEPADCEMLGMCHVILEDPESAGKVFREGLVMERERDPQSALCASLMQRISLL